MRLNSDEQHVLLGSGNREVVLILLLLRYYSIRLGLHRLALFPDKRVCPEIRISYSSQLATFYSLMLQLTVRGHFELDVSLSKL